MARSNSRAKQAEGAEKLDSWGMVKASNLERAWNSKFAKEGGERLAVSPRVSSSPRAVAYSTPISSPQEFTRSPTLLGSAAPVNEAFFDQRARNFPVWSSYQNVQNQNVQRYSPRGVSVPTTRSHLATLEQPRGATTGYVIPPSKGGKSSNRFTDYTPREVRTGYIIPPSKGGKNLNRFFDNTPEVVHGRSLPTGLHTLSSFYLTHDYPKFLTARVTYSDPASPPRTAPGSLRAKLASTEERVDAQESDLQRAERQWEQERILYGLSPRGDFRSFEARRRMLATDLHLTNEQRRSALLLRTDPHWPGPNIWTERGKEVYDTTTSDVNIRGIST